MRIALTGGAGFIGSHLVKALAEAGHELLVIDDLSRGRRERIPRGVRFERLDVSAADTLAALLASFRPDVVNHHAAQISVVESVRDPVADAMVNVVGSLNVLEAARRADARLFVFASSAGAVYGEVGEAVPDEGAAPCPTSPYGVSKLTVERYMECHYAPGGLPCVALRYSNVYGPGQDEAGEAGVVSIFCRAAMEGRPAVLYGDGSQTRDFVHVDDVVRFNLMLLERLASSAAPLEGYELFNVSSGEEVSISRLSGLVDEAARSRGRRLVLNRMPFRRGEIHRSCCSCAKARRLLGWSPRISLSRGVESIFRWLESCAPAPGR